MVGGRRATRFVDLDAIGVLELVRAGDADAYGELFARYRDFADKVARRVNRRHADDLVSESFRRVYTAISRGAGPTQAFGPYLAATIRSVGAGMALPYQETELDVSTLLPDDSGDVDPRVSTAYLSLPETWQNALWYADVEGMSPRHAAPLLGLPSANAFSALRTRARAGLRGAYLTQVVDEACNEDVRRHLEMLMAGTTTPDVVDDLVDEHLRNCDECAAIAWRVAAVTGNRAAAALAPALLAFHGIAASSALLPTGLGLVGVFGWMRGWPKSAVAGAVATSVAVAAGVSVVAVSALRTGGEPAEQVGAPVAPVTVARAAPAPREPAPATSAVVATAPTETTTPATTTPATTTSTTAPTVTTTTTSPVSTTTQPIVIVASPTSTTKAPLPSTTATVGAPSTSTTSPLAGPTAPAVTAPATTETTATSTSTTRTSTTSTTTTTSTTSTTVPVTPPGALRVVDDRTIGLGNGGVKRRVSFAVTGLTGEPGTVTFSRPAIVRAESNLTCGTTSCALGGVAAPQFATAEIEVDPGPLRLSMLDSTGTVIQVVDLP